MDVRNRMADISKLRCNICQDFLRMIARPNWQQRLYDKAKYAIESGAGYKDKYIPAYEKMRDIGVEQYSIDDMDVTLIAEVLHNLRDVFSATDKIRYSITGIKADRNVKGHSNENEDPEELYLQGLLDLVNLRKLVVDIDKFEVNIADEVRLDFRRKYIPLVDNLKMTLDDERMDSLQAAKQIDRDIAKILKSNDPSATWLQVWGLYMNREWKLEKNPQGFNNFIVKASDAGVPQAHEGAMDYFLIIRKDYAEAERRMLMMINAHERLSGDKVKSILYAINTYMLQGNLATVEMQSVIERIKGQGYNISVDQDGIYSWIKQ